MNNKMKELNLINFYAFLIEENKIKAQVIIIGKADENHFICQIISPINGCGNISVLLTIDELKKWVFIDNKDLAQDILNDYYNTHLWRYSNPI